MFYIRWFQASYCASSGDILCNRRDILICTEAVSQSCRQTIELAKGKEEIHPEAADSAVQRGRLGCGEYAADLALALCVVVGAAFVVAADDEGAGVGGQGGRAEDEDLVVAGDVLLHRALVGPVELDEDGRGGGEDEGEGGEQLHCLTNVGCGFWGVWWSFVSCRGGLLKDYSYSLVCMRVFLTEEGAVHLALLPAIALYILGHTRVSEPEVNSGPPVFWGRLA